MTPGGTWQTTMQPLPVGSLVACVHRSFSALRQTHAILSIGFGDMLFSTVPLLTFMRRAMAA
jgi:hypothetical protein